MAKNFDKSKIMSIRVPDYLSMHGWSTLEEAGLKERGVHATAENTYTALERLADRAPRGTQAIVGQNILPTAVVYMVGIALMTGGNEIAFKEMVNKMGDYRILAERINCLELGRYNSTPYTGYSQESFDKVRELKASGKIKFDGPGTRLSHFTFDQDGVLSLSLDYTTYAFFKATRGNTDNPRDNARWLGCSGITVNQDGDDYFMWVGQKSELCEIGAGEIQLTPAGGVNPLVDFGLATTLKRELHEEALNKKPFDLKVERNLAIEMFGSRRFTKQGNLFVMDRDYLELESKIKICQPYMLVDMFEISSLNLMHLLLIDYSKKEIEESFVAIPEEEREFDFLVALEWNKEFLEDYLRDKFEKLRPHLRAALDSVIRNWDYVNQELRIE